LVMGENIRRIRKSKGLTMKDLGKAIDISEQGVGNYERGDREPSIDIISKIAAALGVSVTELIGASEDNNPVKNLSRLAKVELSQIMSSEDLNDMTKEKLLLIDSQINQLVRQSDNEFLAARQGFLALCRYCGIAVDLEPTEDGEVKEACISYKNLEFNLQAKDYEKLFEEVCSSIVKEVLASQYYFINTPASKAEAPRAELKK
jgi:transcriptional regulator with XRE-family HTH domain